ncbi:MAG: tRNA threonylcarbamoyladenosine dehydratase [Elusimicrobia bacterium]|nr:tRNA threonylcarbamoyladenosine dehydratase [Elusimicrobiota bacterium]
MPEDRLARIRLMVGGAGVERLKASFVVVAGLGAVGSYAVEGLARVGVGRLRLVDFDIIKASNINRQLYALGSTIGKHKADIAAARVLDINPDCRVEPLKIFAAAESFGAILADAPDMVIDAIDAMGPKTELIAETQKRGLRLISCMGAALRTDPSAIRVGPFSEARGCPLATRLRYWLRKKNSPAQFTCVYSTEPLGRLRLDARQAAGAEKDYYDRGRQRAALGSLPTVTGIFGLTIANTVIQTLLSGTKPR